MLTRNSFIKVLRCVGEPFQITSKSPLIWAKRCFQKNNYLRTSDGSRKQLKVEVPPRNAGNRRKRFPIEVVLDNRRLSSWRPSPASVEETFTESTLVNKNYCSSLSFSVFFNCGHRCFFQRRIFSSSRSIARPTGRWQTPAKLFQHPPDMSLVYRMPNSRSMTCPTRAAVHKPVSYPNFSGPSFQNRLDSLLLFFAESWFSTGTTSFPKPNPTIFLKLFSPTIDRLPMCPYSTRNIGFAIPFF